MNNNTVYTFEIDGEHAGQRADSVLSLLLEDVSRSYIQKLIESGNFKVNNNIVYVKKYILSVGDIAELTVPPSVSCSAKPEDIPLDIVYEDESLLVVNKPRGMVVHPAAGNLTGTLVNGLLNHCRCLSVINGVERPGIVHRIDKDTSGLLVVAKTDEAHRGLSGQFQVHSITREYEALCFGTFRDIRGIVDAPLGRDPKNRLKMAIVQGGKRAVTHYEVLESFRSASRIKAVLETGRTHQIRVHMASLNHPLIGDRVYGPSKQPFGAQGQLLHAGKLGFIHPVSGEYLEFTAAPPEEFETVLKKLRSVSI